MEKVRMRLKVREGQRYLTFYLKMLYNGYEEISISSFLSLKFQKSVFLWE